MLLLSLNAFTSFYDFQYPNVTTLCLFWTVCECSCFEFFFFSVVQFCLYGTLIIINSLNVYEAHMVDMQPARVSQPASQALHQNEKQIHFFMELFFFNNLRFIYECWLAGWQAGWLTPRLHCLLIVALWFCCHWMMVGLAACWSGCHSFFRLKDQNALIRMQINCFVCCCCCCYLKLLQLVMLLWVHCCCIATEQAPIQKLKFILFLFVRQRHENS